MSGRERESGLMKVGEICKYLRISRSTLYRMMDSGELPGYKVGNTWRFHRDDVRDCARGVSVQKPGQKPISLPLSAPSPNLIWPERLHRYIADLVENEEPADEKERQELSAQWRECGEKAVIEAWRYMRRQRREEAIR